VSTGYGHRWGSIPAAAHRPPVPRGGSACCDIRHPMLWKRDLLHVLIHGLSADVSKTKEQGDLESEGRVGVSAKVETINGGPSRLQNFKRGSACCRGFGASNPPLVHNYC
jgi:hypothetical protein